jgi:hypothetical protein
MQVNKKRIFAVRNVTKRIKFATVYLLAFILIFGAMPTQIFASHWNEGSELSAQLYESLCCNPYGNHTHDNFAGVSGDFTLTENIPVHEELHSAIIHKNFASAIVPAAFPAQQFTPPADPVVTAISAGHTHSLAIDEHGRLWACVQFI